MTYLYLSISVPPFEPVVIRFQSPIPNETGGTSVEFYELSHPTLGQGAAHGFTQSEMVAAANGTSFVQLSGTTVLPPNVLTFN